MGRDSVIVEWEYSGKTDALVGTGACRSEKFLAYGFGGVIPLLYVYLYLQGSLDWAWWQFILAALMGIDLGAGVVANALNSCKRFYHTPLKENEPSYVGYLKQPILFALIHIYPFIVAVAYPGATWFYGISWYGLLLVSAWLVLQSPLYLRRPIAFGVMLLVILMNLYFIPAPPGFEWLVPALFLKIILGHQVREEPYRPSKMLF